MIAPTKATAAALTTPLSLAARFDAAAERTMRAIPQPKLCDDMPHRFMPIPKAPALCIRCGVSE